MAFWNKKKNIEDEEAKKPSSLTEELSDEMRAITEAMEEAQSEKEAKAEERARENERMRKERQALDEKTLETAAGYVQLSEPVLITVTDSGVTYNQDDNALSSSNQGVHFDTETQIYTLVVTNDAGFELPSTGGRGTMQFYILAGVIQRSLPHVHGNGHRDDTSAAEVYRKVAVICPDIRKAAAFSYEGSRRL